MSVHLAVDERLRVEAHRHELVVDVETVDLEHGVDADLVALDAADALADEVGGLEIGVSASQQYPNGERWYMAAMIT